jgi:hypothetical protein
MTPACFAADSSTSRFSTSERMAMPAAIETGEPENVPDWKIRPVRPDRGSGVTVASMISRRPP